MTDNHHTRLAEREMPEALRLAEIYEDFPTAFKDFHRTATELRRLHTQHQADQERIADLEHDRNDLLNLNVELVDTLKELYDSTDTPPDSNCSCHVSAPCGDCVDYRHLRFALKQAKAAIAKATGERND